MWLLIEEAEHWQASIPPLPFFLQKVVLFLAI